MATFLDKIIKLNAKYKLPADINSFSFNKFVQIYIKVRRSEEECPKISSFIFRDVYFLKDNWERILTPLTIPFLNKTNYADIQESLSLFKMVNPMTEDK